MEQQLGLKGMLPVLREAIEAISSSDADRLHELSNHTIHTASLFQDRDSITIAVIMYSISKIIARTGKVPDVITKQVEHCTRHLEKGETRAFQGCLKNVLEAISKADTKLKWYIDEVIQQAQIKKGSRIHEHGISIARAAELLGVNEWDLMRYVGHTNIAEKSESSVSVNERLGFTRRLFR